MKIILLTIYIILSVAAATGLTMSFYKQIDKTEKNGWQRFGWALGSYVCFLIFWWVVFVVALFKTFKAKTK